MSTAILLIENGPNRGNTFPVAPPGIRLGRGPDNDVVLDDDAVTDHHARIDVRRNRYRLMDLGSLNGTFVNQARVQMQELHDGDRLQVGRMLLHFRVRKTGAPTVTAPGIDTADAAALVRRYRTTTPAPRDPRSLAAAHGHLRIILELSEQVAMFFDADEVLQHGVDLCVRSFEPDRVVMFMREGQDGELQPRFTHAKGAAPKVSDSILRQALEEGQAIRVADARADDRFSSKDSVMIEGIRSVLCVPVRSDAGVVGACYMDRVQSDAPFTLEQLQLAALIANVLGQRLDHIRLYQETLEVSMLKRLNEEMSQTNQKLHELELFKTDMVNMLVHDMKSSVATTMMSLDVIAMTLGDNLTDQARDYLGVAKRNQYKLNEMIMNLLDIDRLEDGRLKPAIGPIDTEEFLARFLETVGPYAAGAKVTLVLDREPQVALHSDPALLERMLLNLVMNAINHSPKGSTVTLRLATPDADHVTLSVEDEGEGIPPELHERIFDKFVQADARELGLKSDVGLGLAFCRLAANALSGDIHVQSAVGSGSTFTLVLPNRPPA